MREIKFRGKDYNGKWCYGLLPYKNQIREFTNHEWVDKEDDNRVKTYATTEDISILSDTLGQFTGLYDKNGKEIYEGDLVRITENGCMNGFIGIVEYNINSFDLKNIEDYNVYEGLEFYEEEQFEIIGNVYDNPELLEEKDEN